MMAAPLAGIVFWILVTLALYVSIPPEFALHFDSAAGFALAALALLSFSLAWPKQLTRTVQLRAYVHFGYWHPMDTLRDPNFLEDEWTNGRAKWRVW